MTEDRRGVALSLGNSASLEIYEKALRAFNIYRGDAVAIIDEALADAPDFISGEIFRAYMHVGLWDADAVAEVRAGLGRLKALASKSNDRERAHAAALGDWAAGDWQGMRARLERISIDHPHDLLARVGLFVSSALYWTRHDRDFSRAVVREQAPDHEREES